MVLLEGGQGIGKTGLLRAARATDAARDVQWRQARGSDRETDFAFGVVRQLFEDIVTGAPDALSGAAALAADAVRPLTEPGAASTEITHAVTHGLFWLVADLADRGPLVLCVDDIHWSDAASVRFLDHLAVRIEGMPVLVLAAARSGEGTMAFGPVARLAEQPTARTLTVPPLDRDAVATVVRDRLGPQAGPDLCDACGTASGGNPFLLTELLDELARTSQGALSEAASVAELAPSAIIRSLQLRLEHLAGDAGRLVRAAALLGDGADLAIAAHISGLTFDDAAEAADELVRSSVLLPGRPLRFVHPVVQSAALALVPSARRSAMHRAAAIRLDRVAQLDAAAAHALATDPCGDPAVLDLLRRAGRSARARGVPDVASTYLRRALREPPAEADHADVLLELGTAAALAGEEDAGFLLEEAHRRAPSPGARLAAALAAGDLLALRGRPAEAVDIVRDALAGDELPTEMQDLARGMLAMWSITTVTGRRASATVMPPASSLVRVLGADAPPPLLAIAAFELAAATGTATEAIATAHRAWADGQIIHLFPPGAPFPFMAIFGIALAGDLACAERWTAEAERASTAAGSALGAFGASMHRARLRLTRGDVRGAAADAQGALEIARQGVRMALLQPLAVATLMTTLVESERLAEAEALAAEPHAGVDPSSKFSIPFFAARASLHAARGRHAEALADLEICRAWERAWSAPAGAWTDWRLQATRAHLALGDRDNAERLALEALERGSHFGSAQAVGLGLRAKALVASGAVAADLAQESARTLREGGLILEAARSTLLLSLALRAVGQVDRARELACDCAATADRLGAHTLHGEASRALIAMGARPRRRPSTGIDALTAAERRVVDLAADGMTNREIAQTLFLTPKTVENHLTAAYRKLGITSRAGLSDALGAAETV